MLNLNVSLLGLPHGCFRLAGISVANFVAVLPWALSLWLRILTEFYEFAGKFDSTVSALESKRGRRWTISAMAVRVWQT